MARRGFFAELQHQAKLAAREAERARAAQVRQHAAAVRESERAHKAAQRAAAQAARATESERKRLEKQARDAHVAAMQATVEERNTELAEIYGEIDSLLEATLGVDDFVDLEQLRQTAQHPPFLRADLEQPIPPPTPLSDPPEPVYMEPPQPSGLFGRKKRHAELIASAQATHAETRRAWQAEMAEMPARRQAATDQHSNIEAERIRLLEQARAAYAAECEAREAQVVAQNAELDTLIANLGYGTTEAVQEYISIVLSNSVYPDHFSVRHEFSFDPATAELALRCLIPGPSEVKTIKAYKYTKATDEITEAPLTQKATKDRYAGAVHQVALRTLHEVFEADRRGLVRSISLEVGTETVDPATGIKGYVPFVAVGAEREPFLGFNLSEIVPAATLKHLGAAVSKDPFALIPADLSGIRRA